MRSSAQRKYAIDSEIRSYSYSRTHDLEEFVQELIGGYWSWRDEGRQRPVPLSATANSSKRSKRPKRDFAPKVD
jgi:hypothetical protein